MRCQVRLCQGWRLYDSDMVRIRKAYELKGQVAEDEGTLSGMASPVGKVDRGGDVVFPGCYQAVLGDFLRTGFVPVNHDWDDLPVAFPTEAFEGQGPGGYGLHATAKFHSTQKGQDARTVCRERLDAGMSVGLSVGMILDRDGYQWLESGAKLLEYAAANGYDMALFDTAGIAAWDRPMRALTKCRELFEFSIATVPMADAWAYSAKSAAKEDLQGEPHTGLTLKDHLSELLSSVAGGVDRIIQARSQRLADGRDLNPERKAEIITMIDAMKSLATEAGSLISDLERLGLSESDDSRGRSLRELELRHLESRSRVMTGGR